MQSFVFFLGIVIMISAINLRASKRIGPWLAWAMINCGVLMSVFADDHPSLSSIIDGILTPFATGWVVMFPEHWQWIIKNRAYSSRGILIFMLSLFTYAICHFISLEILRTHAHIAVTLLIVSDVLFRSIWYAFILGDNDSGNGLRHWAKLNLEKLKWVPPEAQAIKA